MIYRYHINLHERGEFYADVRNPITGESVAEFHTDQVLELIEDGFINNPCDAGDVETYLRSVGIITMADEVRSAH